jgi:long-subunit fatty acid transport protein
MRFLSAFVALSAFSVLGAYAQSGYYEDAYRFSRNNPTGSARIIGIGGTQYSLGGDVSNIAGNPAGLGFFRKSELSLSLGYSDWKVDTKYLGQSKTYNTSNFSIPNASYVMASPKGELDSRAFKGGSFGISFQRLANFNTEYGYFSNQPGESSIIDFYLQDAFGLPENQIQNYGLTGLAYATYLINPVAFDEDGNPIQNPDTYDSFVLGNPFQDENITQEGSASQMTFSYGANFNHKVFIGGGLGVRSLNFSSLKTYNETFDDQPLEYSSLRESLVINGVGVNVNLGLIYKPVDYLNLGFVFQSPTWYSLNEEYEAGMVANYKNYKFEQENKFLNREEAVSDLVISNYGLNTPLKIGAGATFFVGKNGFISADVDWVDYSAGRLSSKDFDEGPDNQAIKSIYTSTINFRVGGEARFNIMRVRAGYGYYGDPYAAAGSDQSTQQISGGIGAKFNAFTVDLAVVSQKYNSLYRSYQVLDDSDLNYGPLTEMKNNLVTGVLTLGISF